VTFDPDRISKLAAAANRADEEKTGEILGERQAKARFLRLLVAAARPALAGVCSKVPGGGAGAVGKEERTEGDLGFRGFLVAGEERPVPVRARSGYGYESLEGKGLYLSEDGVFFEVVYAGRIERGGAYAWDAEAVGCEVEAVVDRRWPVGEIAEAVADELEAAAAGKNKAAEKARRVSVAVRKAAEMLSGVR
jgi:hypothetical protein